MAICTTTYLAGGRNYVITAAGDPTTCAGNILLSKAEYVDWLAQMSAFGFDQALFEKAFGAGLLLFCTGLGVGLIISTLRKAKPR